MTSIVEPTQSKISVEELKSELFKPLSPVLNGQNSLGEVSLLCPVKSLKDATVKLLVKNSQTSPVAVAMCSSAYSPQMVARAIERSVLAKQALGAELGRVILDPLYQGEVRGLSYALFPYYQPLSDRRLWWMLQRTLLSSYWLKWLSDVARATVTEVTPAEIETNFIFPLKHLMALEAISDRVRSTTRQVLERLLEGKWIPRHVLMHNDLWKGNILLTSHHLAGISNRSSTERFKIIDWGASTVKGYGMYDLIRLAKSIKLGRKQLRTQVDIHCQILGCDSIDARSHLLTALGYLSIHLEEFALSRFVQLADSCLDDMEQVQGSY